MISVLQDSLLPFSDLCQLVQDLARVFPLLKAFALFFFFNAVQLIYNVHAFADLPFKEKK